MAVAGKRNLSQFKMTGEKEEIKSLLPSTQKNNNIFQYLHTSIQTPLQTKCYQRAKKTCRKSRLGGYYKKDDNSKI